MALWKGGGFNEGSLLRRTLLHIGTFALGSFAFVAIVSFTLVTAAKSLLPDHTPKDGARKEASASAESEAPAKAAGASKIPRPKRAGVIVEEETPNRDSSKE
jgi:hypothetical protein